MAFNIDDLEIQIVAKSINAIEQLSKLSRSLRTLSKIELDSSKITNFVNDIAELGEQGESLKIVAVELNEIARALNKFKVPKEVTNMAANIKSSYDPEDIMFAEDAPSLSKAGKNIDNFLESIKRLDDVGKNLEGVKNLADLMRSLAESSNELKKVSISMKAVGTAAKSASHHSTNLVAAFARIARLRAFRYIIRKVVEYLHEGVQMFIEWDRAANGGMAGAAGASDRLKEALAGLKGQLGAFVGGLLTQLEPALNWLISALTKVVDTIQMISRALQGNGTYYKYVAGSMKEATGAAKALKNVLFGFDELNVLPSESGGGGSSSGITGGYELIESDSWIEQIRKEIEGEYEDKPLMKTILFGALTAKKVLSWIGENVSAPIVNWFKTKAFPWVGNAINDIWNAITTFFTQTIPNWWKQHITDPITRFLTRVIGNIRTFIDNVIMAIGEVVYFITHPFTDSWADMCARIKSQWKTFTLETEKTSDEMKTKVVNDFNEMSQDGGNSGLKLQKEWALTAEEVKKKAEEAKTNVAKTVEDLVSEIVDEVGTLEKRLKPPKLELTFKVNANGVPEQISKAWGEIQKNLRTTPIYFSLSSATNVTEDYVNDSKQKLRNMTLLANGGSPDIGTLFWAGEAGAEVVANTSHGTGVMNVSQMQEAVANGNIEVVNAVYAMANMVVNAVNTKDFDVYMDASKVGQSVSKWQFNQARRGITQGAY